MNAIIRRQLANRKRRLHRRINKNDLRGSERPLLTASTIHYDIAQRNRGMAFGGLGAIHLLARELGLVEAIDGRLHLLKIHLPYHESDHVLNLAYNALCGGTCLEDLELRRTDEVFLDALGARRIPDPTTAGDFCRRFRPHHVGILQDTFDLVRQRVWAQQPHAFFDEAILDMDGILVETTGQCKEGMDLAYDGTWGYHPLVLTLANTGEVLRLINRPGSRPSHDGAAAEVDRGLATCFRGGFRRVLLRGDTDFSQTQSLDRWTDDPRVTFLFGYDANAKVKDCADWLPPSSWRRLHRPPRYRVQTKRRSRPPNVKEQVVVAKKYDNICLQSEDVAEFPYRPTACRKTYRMVVVRKNLSVEKGERFLFPALRYFFYLTNDWRSTAAQIVCKANGRCNQENTLAQLSGGVRALRAPVDSLTANEAYMVMTALAWNLKAWWGLRLPEAAGRWQEKHQEDKRRVLGMEFKTFVNAFVRLPCQIVRSGRKLVYRLLSWNAHLPVFFRLLSVLRC